jgi:hypothetical protein
MEEERSPILDIVDDESEVPRLEMSPTGTSSEGSWGGGSGDNVDAEAEGIGAMDPHGAMTSVCRSSLSVGGDCSRAGRRRDSCV